MESFTNGIPVIISDQTPWKGISEEKVGWDISLADVLTWENILYKCYRMREDEYKELVNNCFTYSNKMFNNNFILSDTIDLFKKN